MDRLIFLRARVRRWREGGRTEEVFVFHQISTDGTDIRFPLDGLDISEEIDSWSFMIFSS